MNKNKLKFNTLIISFAFSILFFGSKVDASSFNLTNNMTNVKKGDVVSMVIGVNSQDQSNYTFSISASFDKNILSVVDWKYKEGWIPLSVEEYDLVDNTNGKIIKTAGYGGGLNESKDFGVITFIAKKDGQVKVTLNDESFVLNEDNTDSLVK